MILGNMRQLGTTVLICNTIGLCLLLAGCSQSFRLHKRQTVAQPVVSQQTVAEKVQFQRTKERQADEWLTLSDSMEAKHPLHDIVPVSGEEAPMPEELPRPEPEAGPLQPLDSPTEPKSENSAPTITLHVDNLDVRKALEMISRQAQVSVLVSPGVKGNVTLDLRDKPIEEMLEAIAKLCGLHVRRLGNVFFVSTIEEVRLNEETNLPVRVYRLNYVRSADVEKMVKPLLSKKGTFTASPDSEIGLKSDASAAGSGVNSDEVKAGGNSMAGGEIVIVQDYQHVLNTVDRVIAQIDVRPIQVLIEAVIVSVKLDKGMDLGVNFALLDGAGKTLGVVGSGSAINAAAGFTPASVITTGGKLAGTNTSGFSEAANGLKFGFVDESSTSFIRALETLGETKVLASPRLLVLNKQRAEIHLGDRIGYKTSTQTQTSTVEKVEFVDVGTQLRLRPFVSADGMIRLEIHPERSSGELKDGVPQIRAAQVTSNVLIPNGTTIVIGGLLESNVEQKWSGIPLLSRLPWLGYLFRGTTDETKKTELVVILTPYIWMPETPDQLNYLGRPRTLGLDERVSQKPCEERRDGLSLFELTRPEQPMILPMQSQ